MPFASCGPIWCKTMFGGLFHAKPCIIFHRMDLHSIFPIKQRNSEIFVLHTYIKWHCLSCIQYVLPCIIWFKHGMCDVFSSWHHLYTSIRLHALGTIHLQMPYRPCVYHDCWYTMHVKNGLSTFMCILAFGVILIRSILLVLSWFHAPSSYILISYITTIIIYRIHAYSRRIHWRS